jgi:hypothetical protein
VADFVRAHWPWILAAALFVAVALAIARVERIDRQTWLTGERPGRPRRVPDAGAPRPAARKSLPDADREYYE